MSIAFVSSFLDRRARIAFLLAVLAGLRRVKYKQLRSR